MVNPDLLLVSFVIYLIAALAEVNRMPFDLPETGVELVRATTSSTRG